MLNILDDFIFNVKIKYSSPYTRTFIFLILHSSYEVRRQAFDIIRRLANNLRSTETDTGLTLLDGLNICLNHFQTSVNEMIEIFKISYKECLFLFRMNYCPSVK